MSGDGSQKIIMKSSMKAWKAALIMSATERGSTCAS